MTPEGAVAAGFKRAMSAECGDCRINTASSCLGFLQYCLNRANKMPFCFKILSQNDLGNLGQKVSLSGQINHDKVLFQFHQAYYILVNNMHWQWRTGKEEFIQILSASENLQQALTFWWMTWSSSCCMQYWLWSSITQSVFGHQSRASVKGTISISIAPPSVTARKSLAPCLLEQWCPLSVFVVRQFYSFCAIKQSNGFLDLFRYFSVASSK